MKVRVVLLNDEIKSALSNYVRSQGFTDFDDKDLRVEYDGGDTFRAVVDVELKPRETIVVYGDSFADDSPRVRKEKAIDLVNQALKK